MVWFDRGDIRSAAGSGNAEGGDVAYGNYKGQRTDGGYAAGAAYMSRIVASGEESRTRCCAARSRPGPAGLTHQPTSQP